MTTSSLATETALAKSVRVNARAFIVELQDGRTVSVPLQWYPRLAHGSTRERQQWGPALDEDISVDGLLLGLPSGEREESFKRWLNSRPRRDNRRLQPAKARRKPAQKRAPRERLRG